MSHLYLVRHGQASFGSRDYDQLSPLGHTQAELLGQWLANSGLMPGHVLHGTLKRQKQTAEKCLATWLGSAAGSITPLIDNAFNEFDHKEVLLRTHPQFGEPGYLEQFLAEQSDGRRAFQKLFAESVTRWVSSRHDSEYTETWQSFRERCVAGLFRAADAAQQGDVWIFTSGGPIAAIMQYTLGLSIETMLDLNWTILNGSISHFTHRQGRTRLRQFNSVSHLTLAERPDLHTYR